MKYKHIANILFGIGIGLAVHDFILEAQQITNPYRWPPHGFWIGIALALCSWFILIWEDIKVLIDSIHKKVC